MGHIFEELLRKFSEMSNETAGEHFTPREVIELMVNLLFAEDDEVLAGAKPVRTMYDPACGTGGMLTGAQNHLRHRAGRRSGGLRAGTQPRDLGDLPIRSDDQGRDPSRIVLGNSLTGEDGYPGQPFDYMLANPPFGVDWKKYAEPIIAERESLGDEGRYGPGSPRLGRVLVIPAAHAVQDEAGQLRPQRNNVRRDPDGDRLLRVAAVRGRGRRR